MVPVFVPTVPLRAAFRSVLAERAVVTEFIEDAEYRGTWFNLRRSIRRGIEYCRAQGLSEFCILEDDVYPVDDFQRHLTNAVASQPGEFFYLFAHYRGAFMVERKARMNPVLKAYRKGYHWTRWFSYGGQGVLWPVKIASEFLAWMTPERESDPEFWNGVTRFNPANNGDWRVVRFLADVLGQKSFLLTVPCLVEHLGMDSTLRDVQTGAYIRTDICSQLFLPEFNRDGWSSSVYTDV